MKGLATFFTTPSLARTLVIIAIIVLIFLIIYWWRSGRKKRQQEQQFNQDYQQLTQQSGQQPSYLSSNYTQLASKIYEAGCSGLFCYGTDEDAIYDVFNQMNNDLDVLLLTKAFGLREPRGGICIPIPGTGECAVALGPWLQTELSSGAFEDINNILASKNIQYIF